MRAFEAIQSHLILKPLSGLKTQGEAEFLNLIIHSCLFFKQYIKNHYKSIQIFWLQI